jgi:hypothetical protein
VVRKLEMEAADAWPGEVANLQGRPAGCFESLLDGDAVQLVNAYPSFAVSRAWSYGESGEGAVSG